MHYYYEQLTIGPVIGSAAVLHFSLDIVKLANFALSII
jgi:hypothetical protein